MLLSRNPFLFRGPIPTVWDNRKCGKCAKSQSLLIQRSYSYLLYSYSTAIAVSRNPFLFRGPIPTDVFCWLFCLRDGVAIPSYSEVLFLQTATPQFQNLTWCRNPFLFRGPIPTRSVLWEALKVVSQSLLIQRSYSYEKGYVRKDFVLLVSQSLLIQRSYSYQKDAHRYFPSTSRNPFLFRGPIPTIIGFL